MFLDKKKKKVAKELNLLFFCDYCAQNNDIFFLKLVTPRILTFTGLLTLFVTGSAHLSKFGNCVQVNAWNHSQRFIMDWDSCNCSTGIVDL